MVVTFSACNSLLGVLFACNNDNDNNRFYLIPRQEYKSGRNALQMPVVPYNTLLLFAILFSFLLLAPACLSPHLSYPSQPWPSAILTAEAIKTFALSC